MTIELSKSVERDYFWLRFAVTRSKIYRYHFDTCDSMLIEGFDCNCGHDELRSLVVEGDLYYGNQASKPAKA